MPAKFSENFKMNEKLSIFDIFNEILQFVQILYFAIFSKVFKFYRSFRENFCKKFGKFQKYAFVGGSRGGAPAKLANLFKTYPKNNRKPQVFGNVALILKIFLS